MSGGNQQTMQQQQQPPYIGSKISLISKLNIRYEGTLYTVDAVESTIALAKGCHSFIFKLFFKSFSVQSFGTEDRQTDVFVAPRVEVYDFIIFKASDIKDLVVCEAPKSGTQPNPFSSGLTYDPAIVSISKKPPPEPKIIANPKLSNMAMNGLIFKKHGMELNLQDRPMKPKLIFCFHDFVLNILF